MKLGIEAKVVHCLIASENMEMVTIRSEKRIIAEYGCGQCQAIT